MAPRSRIHYPKKKPARLTAQCTTCLVPKRHNSQPIYDRNLIEDTNIVDTELAYSGLVEPAE
jgi:hypothetical protein